MGNVVISALVAKGVSYRVFLLNSLLNKFDFIAPEFLWTEVEKDKQYFALAIAFNCGIFSGDLKLKEQSKVKIYSPSELLNILQSGRKY